MNNGLIFTNDNCVACNKCISACPALGANKAVLLADGTAKIDVVGDACIACGACFDACSHDARSYRDDTERFFADYKRERRYRYYLRLHLWQIIRMPTANISVFSRMPV